MSAKMLRVGDRVMWRGMFGAAMPREAHVTYIEDTRPYPRSKYGIHVGEIMWDAVRQNMALITLDNGSWAYGEQISPTEG